VYSNNGYDYDDGYDDQNQGKAKMNYFDFDSVYSYSSQDSFFLIKKFHGIKSWSLGFYII